MNHSERRLFLSLSCWEQVILLKYFGLLQTKLNIDPLVKTIKAEFALFNEFDNPWLNPDFANLIWHPRLIKNQQILENVQRRATRLVSGMKNLSDYERLRELNLSSLEYRRKRGTMIEMYKICYGLYDRNATAGLFERNDRDSRGNACKVIVRKANLEMRKNFFMIRPPLD